MSVIAVYSLSTVILIAILNSLVTKIQAINQHYDEFLSLASSLMNAAAPSESVNQSQKNLVENVEAVR